MVQFFFLLAKFENLCYNIYEIKVDFINKFNLSIFKNFGEMFWGNLLK